MAKVPFTKLGLSLNQEVKTIDYNEQTIEVRQYLPADEKLGLVRTVVQAAVDENSTYLNALNVDLMLDLAVVNCYTNISFTDKQKENPAKLHDLLGSTGLLAQIKDNIPNDEVEHLACVVYDTLQSFYKYRNSMIGMMEAIQNDYSDLDEQAKNIQATLGNPDNIALLRQITGQLG
jgi:uncharacterized tellurite resistance protein B-like protein